jgi:hypothetical protein
MTSSDSARFATGNYNATSSVTTMLNHLNLDTLQQCHLRTKAIMMYRKINGLVVIEPPQQQHLHTEIKTTMLAQGRDYLQLKTRSAVLESDCLDFLFEGFQVQGCCCGLWQLVP